MNTAVLEAVESKELSTQERAILITQETIISRGLDAFVAVGEALAIVRDNRLYRENYATFAEYVRYRWNIGKSRAYQLITASGMSTIGVQNERQSRALTQFPDEHRATIFHAAESLAETFHKPLSSGMIERVGETIMLAVTTGTVDIGNGKNTPLIAALTIEEDEAVKRQKQYIMDNTKDKPAQIEAIVSAHEISADGKDMLALELVTPHAFILGQKVVLRIAA